MTSPIPSKEPQAILYSDSGAKCRHFSQESSQSLRKKTSAQEICHRDIKGPPQDDALTYSTISFTNMSRKPLNVALRSLERAIIETSSKDEQLASAVTFNFSVSPMDEEGCSLSEKLHILHNVPFKIVIAEQNGETFKRDVFSIPCVRGGDSYNFALKAGPRGNFHPFPLSYMGRREATLSKINY